MGCGCKKKSVKPSINTPTREQVVKKTPKKIIIRKK